MSLLGFQSQSQLQFQNQRELSRGQSSDASRQNFVEPIAESSRTSRDRSADSQASATEYQTEAKRVERDMYDLFDFDPHDAPDTFGRGRGQRDFDASDRFISSRAHEPDHNHDRTNVTVTTAPELRRAIESRAVTITITGELADKLKKISRITMLTSEALSELEAACASLESRRLSTKIFTPLDANTNVATPTVSFPGGPLGGVLVAASEATGVSVSLIRTISTVGFAMILSLFDDYDLEDDEKGSLRFRLKRRR